MDEDFEVLVERLLQGDVESAEQIVRLYEPEIRRIVRLRLRDPKLRRIIDSTDICQSVFAKFFYLAALGRFELQTPDDLVRLLTKMATNKVVDRHRREDSQRRLALQRSVKQPFTSAGEPIDLNESPVTAAEYRERLTMARNSLSPRERKISELRIQGKSWLEISQQMGQSPQALRKCLERACQRISKEMGIDE